MFQIEDDLDAMLGDTATDCWAPTGEPFKGLFYRDFVEVEGVGGHHAVLTTKVQFLTDYSVTVGSTLNIDVLDRTTGRRTTDNYTVREIMTEPLSGIADLVLSED